MRMLNICCTLLVLCVSTYRLSAQVTEGETPVLNITYSATGNRIQTQIIVIPNPAPIIDKDSTRITHDDRILPEAVVSQASQDPALPMRTGVTNAFVSQADIRVFPNPVQSTVNIEINDSTDDEYKVVLYNLSGRAVVERRSSDKKHELDFSSLATAHYILHITSRGTKRSWKIIKN